MLVLTGTYRRIFEWPEGSQFWKGAPITVSVSIQVCPQTPVQKSTQKAGGCLSAQFELLVSKILWAQTLWLLVISETLYDISDILCNKIAQNVLHCIARYITKPKMHSYIHVIMHVIIISMQHIWNTLLSPILRPFVLAETGSYCYSCCYCCHSGSQPLIIAHFNSHRHHYHFYLNVHWCILWWGYGKWQWRWRSPRGGHFGLAIFVFRMLVSVAPYLPHSYGHIFWDEGSFFVFQNWE